ncbi:hypothetical protein BT63DRAFT_453802 [Microthyrium microscopicum]|uniref:DUF7492 domain-containing protein n=1 Tax=Microthyrium microscopicum TaxID=703497 RepID=A0A6A6UI79_9PEZI|nr:hypothetical protein BT63DRAFT_453802 [Microthyrium microscopicum]
MISYISAFSVLAATVSAHSWVECSNHDNSLLLPWMQGNSTLNPPVIIDPEMPWYANFCHGYPRNKKNPGDWIDESTNYSWDIIDNVFNGGPSHPPNTNACHPTQRTPTYQPNAPMASAAPGDSIKLFFGGNGHTRGSNVPGGDPGIVNVYWKGAPEQEITDVSEFTSANLLATGGFAGESFSYPADPNIKTPAQGLVDKGNWLTVKMPADMAAGRHMMVWVWEAQGKPTWSTCFDVMVGGSGSGSAPAAPASSSSPSAAPVPAAAASSAPAAPAYSAPAAAASPLPALPSVVAAPAPAAPSAPVAPAPAAPVAPQAVQEPAPSVSAKPKTRACKAPRKRKVEFTA